MHMTRTTRRFASCPILVPMFACTMLILGSSPAILAQTPTPTPITKPDPPVVQNPSTVGRIIKFTGATKNSAAIIGDSVITESAGNVGIDVTNPSDKLTVGGGFTATGAINTNTHFSINGNRVLVLNLAKFNLFSGYQSGNNNYYGHLQYIFWQ